MVNVFNNMNNGMALQRKKYPVLTTKLFLNSSLDSCHLFFLGMLCY